MERNNNRKWQITLTEEQLQIMIQAVEDWHRFICGQCSLDYATSYINNPKVMSVVRGILDNDVKRAMFTELSHGDSYSWCGGHPNPHMSKAASISYLIYREARHQMEMAYPSKHYSVYQNETLTCKEQGQMIEIKPLD